MDIDSIQTFIRLEVLDDEDAVIGVDDDLLLTEVLDSHSVMRLVAHIEESMNVEIPAEDVTVDNFSSLRQIDAYLKAHG